MTNREVAKILRETAQLLLAGSILLLGPSFAHTQDLKAFEKELKSSLKGRVLTMKRFDRSNWLRFNAQGDLIDGGSSGPWTLYS
ncbi:MAG: hypothetical protein ACRD4T_14690, partial [Candidatus Acidiferrales bacterium]